MTFVNDLYASTSDAGTYVVRDSYPRDIPAGSTGMIMLGRVTIPTAQECWNALRTVVANRDKGNDALASMLGVEERGVSDLLSLVDELDRRLAGPVKRENPLVLREFRQAYEGRRLEQQQASGDVYVKAGFFQKEGEDSLLDRYWEAYLRDPRVGSNRSRIISLVELESVQSPFLRVYLDLDEHYSFDEVATILPLLSEVDIDGLPDISSEFLSDELWFLMYHNFLPCQQELIDNLGLGRLSLAT